MRKTNSHAIRRLTAIAPALAATALLAACGSSSTGSSSTGTTAQAATTTTSGGAALSAQVEQLRECLRRNGIDLPAPKPGQTQNGGALPFDRGGFSGSSRLPSGVTRAQYEAAVKKCGGFPKLGGQAQVNKAGFKKSLEAFAACMRQHGIPLPPPNTSGKGPLLDTKGVNTNSSAFRSAQLKCLALLRTAHPGGESPTG